MGAVGDGAPHHDFQTLGGLRPIRIECATMQLMSATAAVLARVIIAPGLRPIQLGRGWGGVGWGIRCGVEIRAKLLGPAYSRDDTDLRYLL